MTQAERDALVAQTNAFRAGVSPTATDMLQVVWDEKLAIVASKWARQCSVGHEADSDQRAVPTRMGCGSATCGTRKVYICNYARGVNGGQLNIDTCRCDCFPIYSGDSCEIRK
ncbi:cysteine-rich venom protein-like [Patella vulgata]|uniref:cysteine-rich venom protein-like n=1 Tax=Patella vulgata TaxID=6465 RepID=UPI0021808EDF|nr:cysteine-rich venom protein-like [Patella vulgata]